MRVEVSSQPRTVPMLSNKFVCPRCLLRCMEFKPVFPNAYGAAEYFRRYGRLPQTQVRCPNGCHRQPGWGFRDISMIARNLRHRIPKE